MKAIQIIPMMIAFVLLLTSCSEAPTVLSKPIDDKKVVLRFGHDMPTKSPQHDAALRFAKLVDEHSGGQVQIKVFPNQSLGTDRQMLAMAMKGELDIVLPPTAKLSHIIPELQIFDLPYLLPNARSADLALDGKVGNTLLSKLDQHNLLGVTFWTGGFKQLTTNAPIKRIDDFQKLRFRTMQSNLIRDQFTSWGAQSVAIDFGKTFEALKNNVVDGQENPLISTINMKFHDVQKHLYVSNHGYLAQMFILSKQSFEKLSKTHQKIIIDTALEVTPWQRAQSNAKHSALLEQLKDHPIEVRPLPKQVSQFMRKRARRLLEQHRFDLGTELVEDILQVVDGQKDFGDDELVIAIDADMSGNSSLSGLAIKRGIELAIDEVNQSGGVLGKKLAVIARDNSMIPARGLANLKKFSLMPNLLAVFSGISSPVVLSELAFIHQNKMLMLDPWAAATPIIDNTYDPNFVFRISVRDEFAADFLLENALKVSDKVGFLLVDNGWGRSNHKALLSAMNKRGLTPTTTQWFEWGKKDFGPTVNNLYQMGSEVIIYVGNPIEASAMIEQIGLKPTPLPVISHWGITGGYFPKLAGEALKKVDLRILQTFSFIDNKRAKVVDFVKNYKTRYAITQTSQIVAPVGTAHAYDLTHILVKAVEKAGSTDPDSVRKALELLKYHSGLVKEYSPPFSPTNHDALKGDDFILTRYENGYLVPFTNKTGGDNNQ